MPLSLPGSCFLSRIQLGRSFSSWTTTPRSETATASPRIEDIQAICFCLVVLFPLSLFHPFVSHSILSSSSMPIHTCRGPVLSKMKYDIPTLLALRHDARISVEKFSPQALGNNLIRGRNANMSALSERTINGSRDASNTSHQREAASLATGGSQRLPCRQPSNPPQGTLAQTDAGFARFLKEHASPKHQRVTAGGRIVPMSPAPAPKMKLPETSQDSNEYKGREPMTPTWNGRDANETPVNSLEGNPSFSDDFNGPSSSARLTDECAKLSEGYPILGPKLQAPSLFPNFLSVPITSSPFLQPNVSLPFNSQPLLQPEPQVQDYMTVFPNYLLQNLGAEPLQWVPSFSHPSSSQNSSASFTSSQSQFVGSGMQSDSPACSSLFGVNHQPFFNPVMPGSDSLLPLLGHPGHPGGRMAANNISAMNVPLHRGTFNQMTGFKSLQGIKKEYEVLSTQLSRLDRYMALHTWELSPRSKRSLVERRINLVRELDTVRSYKEQLESVATASESTRLDTQKQPSTEFPVAAAQFVAGGNANGHNMPIPWPNSIANYGTPVLYSPVGRLPQSLPVNEPFDAAFNLKGNENPSSFDNSSGLAGVHTGMHTNNSYELDSRCNWSAGRESMEHGFQSLDAESTGSKKPLDPVKAAPANIRQIYREIEDAISRGDSVEDLIKDLAAMTARNARTNNNSNGSPQPGPKRLSKASMSAPSTRSFSRQGLQGVNRHVAGVGSNSEPNYATRRPAKAEGDAQREAHTARRTWKSEGSMRTRSSSYVSTDSWATSQEDNGKTHKRSGKGNKIGHQGSALQARAWENSEVSARAKRATVHRAHDSAASNNSTNPVEQAVSDSMKPVYPQFLTQCLNGKRDFISQKTTPAAAVSQKVNAHGFLPPFDGAGDIPVSKQPQADTDDRLALGGAENGNSQQRPWYMKKRREKPSPAILREFFHRIQVEEANMIYKYHMEHPNALSFD